VEHLLSNGVKFLVFGWQVWDFSHPSSGRSIQERKNNKQRMDIKKMRV